MGPITVKVMDFEMDIELATLAFACIPMIGDHVQLEEGCQYYEVKRRVLPPFDSNRFIGNACIWVECEETNSFYIE